MVRARIVLPAVLALALPLSASAEGRKTVHFSPVKVSSGTVDTAKLSDIVKNLKIGAPVTGSIGPAGGSLRLGDLTLEFPKGALAKPTQIAWVPVQHPGIAFGFLLQPREIKLNKPLWLHTPKADLEFQVPKFGSYVLVPDKKQEGAFHLVDLATVIPTPKTAKTDQAAKAPKAPDH